MKIPQGLTKAQFDDVAALLRSEAGHIGDDILVHGSRAKGNASAKSDIDFAIRVSHEKFDAMIKSRFGSPTRILQNSEQCSTLSSQEKSRQARPDCVLFVVNFRNDWG